MTYTQDAESPDTGNYYRFKVLGARIWSTGNGYDEGERVSFRVIGSKTLSQADQRLALAASINGRNCTHDYDCCGCAITYAAVRKVKPGVFAVQVRTSYNY